MRPKWPSIAWPPRLKREDDGRIALKQRLELVVLEQRAGLRVVDAETLAQHAADFDRKAFVPAVIGKKALGVGQEFEHQRVAAFVIADEARHQTAQRGHVARQFVAGRLALQGQHGVGLHVAHLLDEQTGRVLAERLEVAVAAARVNDGECSRRRFPRDRAVPDPSGNTPDWRRSDACCPNIRHVAPHAQVVSKSGPLICSRLVDSTRRGNASAINPAHIGQQGVFAVCGRQKNGFVQYMVGC